jgi:hydrogenase maturation protein HypF
MTDVLCKMPLRTAGATPIVLDWAPLVQAVIAGWKNGADTAEIATGFHNTLVEGMVAMAKAAGEPRVALSGGCFQNKYLTERSVTRLEQEGFHVFRHQRIPPNDGGIALGQVVGASGWHRLASCDTDK